MIQPQDLELKHLEFHSHLCPFQMIKTSFVLKLVHCVLSGIINTWHHRFLSGWVEGRPLLYPETSGVLLLLAHIILPSQASFKKRIGTCPWFWTFRTVFYQVRMEVKSLIIISSYSLNYVIIKGTFLKTKPQIKT